VPPHPSLYRGLSAAGVENLPEAGVHAFSVYTGGAGTLAGNLCPTAMAVHA